MARVKGTKSFPVSLCTYLAKTPTPPLALIIFFIILLAKIKHFTAKEHYAISISFVTLDL